MRRPRGRGVAALVAILALSVAAGAEAKKKKHHKKHKTPAGKSSHGKAEPAEPAEPEEQTTRPGGAARRRPPPRGTRRPRRAGAGLPAKRARRADPPRPKHAAATAEAEPEGEFALPALDLVVGAGAMFRSLSWNQDVTSSFAPYSLSPGPQLRLAVEAFPAAFATSGFAANVGLFGAFNYGVAVTSKVQSTGMKLTTSFRDFLVGVKVRLPFGNVVPYASAAYGGQSFRLGGQDPPHGAGRRLQVPSIRLGRPLLGHARHRCRWGRSVRRGDRPRQGHRGHRLPGLFASSQRICGRSRGFHRRALGRTLWAAFRGRLSSIRHLGQQPHAPMRCGWAVRPTATSPDGARWSSFSTGSVARQRRRAKRKRSRRPRRPRGVARRSPSRDRSNRRQARQRARRTSETRVGRGEPHRGP